MVHLSQRFGFCISMVAMLLLIASGCKREGCTDPLSTNYDPKAKIDNGSCILPAPSLSVHFTHVVGGVPFTLGATYSDSSGRRFQLNTARFYVSSPALVASTGATPIAQYLHVVAGDNQSYPLGEVPAGDYTGFRFDVGVDSVTNHSDPLLFPEGHALAATSPTNDHWTWNVGYVFLKIEGLADTSASMTGNLTRAFDMHIATDPLLRTVNLAQAFTVAAGQPHVLDIKIDWLRALSGYDFRRSTHTNDGFTIAARAMNNFVTGITIQ
jgi:hypothetical protein